MSIKDNIIKNIINPTNASNYTSCIATVSSYDQRTNRANLFMEVMQGGKGGILRDVPIQLSNGVHLSGLREGEEVYVQFVNGSIFTPKIVGRADEIYERNTRDREKHLRKGSLHVKEIEDVDIPESYTPSSNSWVDYENKNLFKTLEFKELSVPDKIFEEKDLAGFFKDKEVGLYNPVSSSIIKVLDNGDILIYGDNNVGLKVNVKDRLIEASGDFTLISDTVNIKASKLLNIESDNFFINGEKYEK